MFMSVPFDECQQQRIGLGRQRRDLLAAAEQALVFIYAERPELVQLLSLLHGQETFVRTTSELPKDTAPAAPILLPLDGRHAFYATALRSSAAYAGEARTHYACSRRVTLGGST